MTSPLLTSKWQELYDKVELEIKFKFYCSLLKLHCLITKLALNATPS